MTDQDKARNQGATAPDPFEMFRRLWAPLGLPVPGMTMPTLDPAEVEKRISDLRSVEAWLGMNLNMVKMAIQGLEMQKLALEAMKANAGAASDAANVFVGFSRAATAGAPSASAQGNAPQSGDSSVERGASNPLENPMLWPWAMMQGGIAPEAAKDNPVAGTVDESAGNSAPDDKRRSRRK